MNALINIQENKTPNGEFDYARSVNRNNQNQAREVDVSANQSVVNNVNSGSANKSIMLKTGDILHAVLETAVNSKEPSPIMAKIVTGDLKGTRLVGSIGVSGKKVVLQFNRANVPGLNKSLNISAVAIDPETSRTAMASEVNNHYFANQTII